MYEYFIIGIIIVLLLIILFNSDSSNQSMNKKDIYNIIPGTSEFVIPNKGGIVLQGGPNSTKQQIRCSGTGTTTQLLSGSPFSTNNQIQFYTNNNCVAAFDVSGLLISDNYKINIGNLQLYHNITSYINSSNTIDFLSSTNKIMSVSSSNVIMNYPLNITNALTMNKGNININNGGTLTINNGTISSFEISSVMLSLGNSSIASCLSNFGGASSKIKIGNNSLIYYIYNTIL